MAASIHFEQIFSSIASACRVGRLVNKERGIGKGVLKTDLSWIGFCNLVLWLLLLPLCCVLEEANIQSVKYPVNHNLRPLKTFFAPKTVLRKAKKTLGMWNSSLKSTLGTYNFTDVSEMKNMIIVGSASYLILLIKFWKVLLLESASDKAMVYVDDNTF
jgi:hypothetical protein